MNIKKERLDKILVEKGMTSSRARAQALILAGKVFVDGARSDKAGSMVKPEADIIVRDDSTGWVSRGALKLLKALNQFHLSPKDRVCLDIGASTGGFTEVLLARGAKKVYAVDVGYGQLAWKLRQNPRVIVMERTNARYLLPDDFPELIEFLTVDASFISLRILLLALVPLISDNAEMVLLLKPQFEAGRENIGKRGVVKDPEVHVKVIMEIFSFVEKKLPEISISGVDFSPVTGPKGNIEFLVNLHRGQCDEKGQMDLCKIRNMVYEAHETLL
ncbi:MAG: TlyA family RNA methyltransferase [Synergistales bacterium]|nr:TlyA family RNA methyltransferase [Synergistales bacterium]